MTMTISPALRYLIAAGRLGTAQEVANACLILVLETSALVNDEIFDANSGMWGD